jgi:hypothetical protein
MKTISLYNPHPYLFSNQSARKSTFMMMKRKYDFLFSQNVRTKGEQLFLLLFLTLVAFLFTSPEAFAVNAGAEMGASTQRLNTLLSGNIMNVIMGIGIAASVVFAFMKSSLIPLGIGIGSGVLYGFAKTWIDTVFALCV